MHGIKSFRNSMFMLVVKSEKEAKTVMVSLPLFVDSTITIMRLTMLVLDEAKMPQVLKLTDSQG